MTRNMKRMGWAAASAALALTASGLLAPAAFAGENPSVAPTSGDAFDANAKALLNANDDVQAVGNDGAGNVVVYTTDAAALEGETGVLSARSSNVVVKEISAPLSSFADTDVVGGAGYYAEATDPADQSGLCSVGFSAFDKSGNPALVSAGHCTGDGSRELTALTLPTSDDAGGATSPFDITHVIGAFGFSQFGGPGNTPGEESTSSVDISVIDVLNDDLTLLPEVTDWSTASSEDLSRSAVPITAVGQAQAGSFSKSGRTTGFTTGEITILNGWANISGRQVYGFGGQLEAGPGDSGGPVIQDGTAVGVVSGGDEATGFFWAADLQAGLALTDGYTVAVDVAEPVLTAPADGGSVGVGGAITGTAPVGTTLKVYPQKGDAFDVAVDDSGNWSFGAPDKLGTYSFALRAFSGYSKSASVEASVEVKAEAPVIATPANGATLENEVTSISGTGLAGATVTLGGDAKGSATVAADGTWAVETDLGIGNYTVTATQARDGQTSAEATTSFVVAPSAPTITGIQDGATYSGAAVPTSVSGTGITGATITVTVNDAKVGEATVKDGAWSIVLKDALGEGSYAVVATQTVDGVSSSASVGFSVVAAPAPSPSNPATPAPGGNGNPGTGNGNGGRDGGLAVTGMGDTAPLAWGAAALLLAGAGTLGVRRLRRATR